MSRLPFPVLTRTRIRVPIAARFDRRPSTLSVIQWLPCPGFRNTTLTPTSASKAPPITSKIPSPPPFPTPPTPPPPPSPPSPNPPPPPPPPHPPPPPPRTPPPPPPTSPPPPP